MPTAAADADKMSEPCCLDGKSQTCCPEGDTGLHEAVQDKYKLAAGGQTVLGAAATGCCDRGPQTAGVGNTANSRDFIATSRLVGYTEGECSENKTLNEGANLGLGCGNPRSFAKLDEQRAAILAQSAGQRDITVMDLGSGAGYDCFLCAEKVCVATATDPEADSDSPTFGSVIGVDMTPDMLARARATKKRLLAEEKEEDAKRRKTETEAADGSSSGAKAIIKHKRVHWEKVEFRLGELDHLPCGDGVVDCVISNCVINLCQDKNQVWREIARVLRPGTGRIAISDIVRKEDVDVSAAAPGSPAQGQGSDEKENSGCCPEMPPELQTAEAYAC